MIYDVDNGMYDSYNNEMMINFFLIVESLEQGFVLIQKWTYLFVVKAKILLEILVKQKINNIKLVDLKYVSQ